MTTSAPDLPVAPPNQSAEPSRLTELRQTTAFWIALVIIAMVVVFGVISPDHVFIKPENLLTVGLNAAEIMILAVGMTFIIGAGQLDLSIGSNVILASVLASKTIVAVGGSASQVELGVYPNLGLALVLGVLVALASGAAFGLVNGLLVTKLRINSFIVTLATTGIGLGIALLLTDGGNIPNLPSQLQTEFGVAKLFEVPVPLILALVIAGVLWIVMRTTRFGLYTCAIGSSDEAAARAGIGTARHVLRLFVMMGLLAGIAAMIDISRFATTNVSGHQTDNLQAIAAVVIGGSSLFGGYASVGGSILGTLVPVTLATGLVIMEVSTFYQLIAVGVILLTAVYFDQRRREKRL